VTFLPALKYHYSHRRFTYGVIGDWHATPGLPGDNATVRHSLWVSAPLASCLESIEKRWGFVLSRDPLAALAPTITPLQPQRSLSPSWLRRGVAGLD